MSLTDMGVRFIERAKAVLSELDHARDEIRQIQGGLHGRISVCLGLLPHLTLLPRALKAFRARYPDVQLDITEGRFPDVESALRSGVVDLFVGPLHSDVGKEFAVEELYEQELAVLCRQGHPLAKARSLRALVHAEWLTNSVTVVPMDEIGPLFARHGLPPPRLMVQSHSALTILVSVAYSDLLVLLPSDVARSELGGPLLHRVPVREAIPTPAIGMIHRVSLPLTPAAEYFADMIRRASEEFRPRCG